MGAPPLARIARLARLAAVAIALGAAALSCGSRAEDDLALDAALRVAGARFVREALPAPSGGPRVQSVSVSPIVPAGAVGRSCSGVVEPSATAVALALDGDKGYWVLPSQPPEIAAPGFPTFATEVSFASSLAAGSRRLLARAVDAEGRFGPELAKPLTVSARALPAGRLVIALSWSNQADLDLHVVDPAGVEIWKRNINSYEPPGPGAPPEPPGTPHPGGVLDFDSNAQCVADGRRAENVVWTDPPPKGHYLVRVDTFSLCGAPNAYWRVEALLDGRSLGAAEGLATERDEEMPHDRGAGVLALEIDVP